jgi:hypothetical protein
MDNSGLIHAFIANDGPYLMLGDGLMDAANQITHRDADSPAFVVSIGRGISTNRSVGHAQPLADIQLCRFSTKPNQPVFMVTVDLEHLYSQLPSRKYRNQPHSHRVEWAAQPADYDTHDFVDTILGRLLLPFSDAVCLFLDDFASSEEAMEMVTRWSRVLANSRTFWKPTLLLVSRRSLKNIDRKQVPAFNVVKSIKVFKRRSKVLEKAIQQAVVPVHEQRTISQSLFSAQHLVSFFKAGLKHTARSLNDLDLVSATRTLNTIDTSLSTHIGTFLELCVKNETSKEFAFRYIASALVMDSCPPGMHRE